METKTRKRTSIDFSEHELIVKETEDITIHWLKKPGSIHQNIKFTNIEGNLVVTGDLGNWIFCRNFVPSEEGFVSDGYWCEKLSIHSEQTGYTFDEELTKEELKSQINGGLEEYGYTGDELDKMKEYMEGCLYNVEEAMDVYRGYAYDNLPSFCDYDDVVFIKDTKQYLKIIFDGFEEICERLKKDI